MGRREEKRLDRMKMVIVMTGREECYGMNIGFCKR